jgi:hypothetical protein
MYVSMIRKKTASGALFFCLLVLVQPLYAQQKTVELGKGSLWKDLLSLDGLAAVPGKWGFKDLVLRMNEYTPEGATEFLFHFNSPGEGDASGAYGYKDAVPNVSTSVSSLGEGSAVFQSDSGGSRITPNAASAFSPGAVWQDFTIEFWLYPSTLARGETVFSWEGGHKEGADVSVQRFSASFQDRRLVWDFRNLFVLPDGTPLSMTLSGGKQLLPRVWHHHLLHFDARIGLLEYLLDGVPEAVTHATASGKEGGSAAVPRIGAGLPGEIVLAPRYTGFLDELRMSRRFVENPSTRKYSGDAGIAVSKIIDLGYSKTRIVRIESVSSSPSDTGIAFYYRISDAWTNPRELPDQEWKPFAPSTDFAGALRGRYVQLMVELYPDGPRAHSPHLSSLAVVYEPNLPPSPPAGLLASPGNGKITLTWRRVNDLNVKGYRVYYGEAPGSYLGGDAANGTSPIDAGDSTRLEITGLSNGKLYYFAIVAYDDSEPPQRSSFSQEVSARPSRIYP